MCAAMRGAFVPRRRCPQPDPLAASAHWNLNTALTNFLQEVRLVA
jgi:hypothetical protein